MKRLSLLLFLHFIFIKLLSASSPAEELPLLNANYIAVAAGSKGKTISLMELSTMTTSEYESISSKKLSFFGRIQFKLGQRSLQKRIGRDGTIKTKYAQKSSTQPSDTGGGFHFGGFALGFLLNIWSLPIVLLINDENKKRRIKWALIGMATVVSLGLLIVFAMAGGSFR